MPLYEYQCKSCGKVVEVLNKSTDSQPEIDCPKCGKNRQFTKLFSTFAAHGSPAGSSDSAPSMSGGCCGGSCGCGH